MCKIWFIGFQQKGRSFSTTLSIYCPIVGTFVYNVMDEKMSSSEDRVKNRMKLSAGIK